MADIQMLECAVKIHTAYKYYYNYGLKIDKMDELNSTIFIQVPEASEFFNEAGEELSGDTLAKEFKAKIVESVKDYITLADYIIKIKYKTFPMKWNQSYKAFAERTGPMCFSNIGE